MGARDDTLAAFAQEVAAYYNSYAFDDPEYNAAALTVSPVRQSTYLSPRMVRGSGVLPSSEASATTNQWLRNPGAATMDDRSATPEA